MNITREQLKEIIREELKALNEKTVRLPNLDINFNRPDQAQLLGNKGRLALSKMDAKGLLYAIQKEFSIH